MKNMMKTKVYGLREKKKGIKIIITKSEK